MSSRYQYLCLALQMYFLLIAFNFIHYECIIPSKEEMFSLERDNIGILMSFL